MIKRILSIILIAAGAVILFFCVAYFIRQKEQDRSAEQHCADVVSSLEGSRAGYDPEKDNRLKGLLEDNRGFEYERYTGTDDMYAESAEGDWYIGTIEIPSLDLKLPVCSSFDEEKIYLTPCRYSGSVYDDSMVIAGSAYDSQFGKLSGLIIGDRVRFTDVFGIYKTYSVSDMQTYGRDSIADALSESEETVDMTLFTWSGTGRNILAVRLSAF